MLKRLFITLTAAAMLAGCSKDSDTEPAGGNPPAGSSLSFTYANPAAALTYAGTVPASAAERAIRDMDVFMFLEDGTFARKLTPGDYTASNDPTAGTTTLTLTNGLLADYAGQSAVFYFVANNAASTGGTHIAAFSGTGTEFRELLTNPLATSSVTNPASANYGKSKNITITPGTGGLLMTGKSEPVYLGGKSSETVHLKRRVARFDIHNPKVAEGIRIENFYITDAATQATLFSNSSVAHTIGVNSTEIVWGPDAADYDAQGYYRSAFYLYPTDLSTTKIAIEVKSPANKARMFELNSDIAIEPNKRYTLVFDGDDLKVDSNTGDWDEGATP